MNKKRFILANAAINSGNKGCSALSYSMLYLIDKTLSDKGIDYEIYLTDSWHKDNGRYSIDINGKQICYYVIDYPIGVGFRDNLKNLLFFTRTIKRFFFFKKIDKILDIGQGDSFSDIYGTRRFELIDRIHKLARFLNIPYCILPQTIGPFNKEDIKTKAYNSIKKAQIVMARDKMSYEYVCQNVPSQCNIAEYIDVAFYLPYKKTIFDKSFIHVGLNISGLLWHGGYTRKNELGIKDDYQKSIRSIIDYFLQKENVKLHLVPHVVNQERGLENDYAVSLDIAGEYNDPRLILSPFFFSPIEAKNYISGLDFFMGARMHSTIAAFSSGVPVIPMSYSRKFNGLFGETLNYNHYIDLKTDDLDAIMKTIQEGFENKDQLLVELESKNELIKKKEKLIIDTLNDFFTN